MKAMIRRIVLMLMAALSSGPQAIFKCGCSFVTELKKPLA